MILFNCTFRGFIRSRQPAKTAAYFVSHRRLLSPDFVDLIKRKKIIRSPLTLASSDSYFKNYCNPCTNYMYCMLCTMSSVSAVMSNHLKKPLSLTIHMSWAGNMAAFDMSLPEAVVSPGKKLIK